MSSKQHCWSNELVLAEAIEKCQGINDLLMIRKKLVSLLMVACLHGNPEYVKDLLKVPGIKIGLQNLKGWHALMYACFYLPGSEVAELLLNTCQAKHIVNLPCNDGSTPLIAAAQKGHTETAALLLRHGALVNLTNKEGLTPLMIACHEHHCQTASLLLHNGADVNMQHHDGSSSLMKASHYGYKDIVVLLLQYGAEVNMKDKDGDSALILASLEGYCQIVSLLLQHGADVNMQNKNGDSSLMKASAHGHTATVSALIQNGAFVNMLNNANISSLLLASECGHAGTVKVLLQNGAKVNKQTQNGHSPLMMASQNGHSKIVSLLIQNGAFVNIQDWDGRTALMMASLKDHIGVVSVLLQNGANVNMQKNDKTSALMIASMSGNIRTVECLLLNGAQVNMKKNNGRSPLMMASLKGHTETVSRLLQNGADVNQQDGERHSSLFIASFYGHAETVSLLLQNGASIDDQDGEKRSSLMAASHQGHKETVSILLENSADVNMQDKSGYSSLMMASMTGHMETAKLLLEHDAHIEMHKNLPLINILEANERRIDFLPATGSKSSITFAINAVESALDIAVVQGNADVVTLLQQNGAKIFNVYSVFRAVTLKHKVHLINQKQGSKKWEIHENIIRQLFSDDSDLISRVQCTKPSTLYMACTFGVLEVVELLLELEVDVTDLYRTDNNGPSYWSNLIKIISSQSLLSSATSQQDSTNREVLSKASWKKYKKILLLLVEKGININKIDNSGFYALGIASREGHTKLVKMLLKEKADVNQQGEDCISSLIHASYCGHISVAELLLRHSAKVDLQDEKGRSALMFAVANNQLEMVGFLLENGAQISLQDIYGNSPLMLSCSSGNVHLVKVLLAHNAAVNLQNNEGITALMIASYNGHKEIVELLLHEYGADALAVTNSGMTVLDISKNEVKPILEKRTVSMIDSTDVGTSQDPKVLKHEGIKNSAQPFSTCDPSLQMPDLRLDAHERLLVHDLEKLDEIEFDRQFLSNKCEILFGHQFKKEVPFLTHSCEGSRRMYFKSDLKLGMQDACELLRLLVPDLEELDEIDICRHNRLLAHLQDDSYVVAIRKFDHQVPDDECDIFFGHQFKEEDPFHMSVSVYKCDQKGACLQIDDIKVVIPSGAIPPGPAVHVEIGVALYGPFSFPATCHPVSPILWFCTKEKFDFKKPVIFKLPHMNLDDEEISLTFAKAGHDKDSTTDMFLFKEIDTTCSSTEYEIFLKHGILSTYHHCFLCIQAEAKSLRDLSVQKEYCLHILVKQKDSMAYQILLVCTYFLETCFNALKKAFPKKIYLYERRQIFRFKDDPQPRLVIMPSTDDDLKITEEDNSEILASDVDFWNNYDYKLMHKSGLYPPYTSLLIHSTISQRAAITLKVRGAKEQEYSFRLSKQFVLSCQTRSEILSKRLHFNILYTTLRETVSCQWEDMSSFLNVSPYDVERIGREKVRVHDCFGEMLKEWLKQKNPPPTKTKILQVLRNLRFNEEADELEAKLLSL